MILVANKGNEIAEENANNYILPGKSYRGWNAAKKKK